MVKEKGYNVKTKEEHFDLKEGYVQFKNGEIISGRIGKSTLGGSKNGLIYQIIKKLNHSRACEFMGFISKLSAKNIGNFGVSFGLRDVTPSVKIADYNINLFK